MTERDYILRIIEQAGSILKHLLRQVRSQTLSRDQLTSDLQRAAQLGGLDLDILRICDAEGLWHVVALSGEVDPARAWLAAETLYLDAIAAEAEGDEPAAMASYVKAATLYRMMEPNWVLPTGFPEATERIVEIDERLTALSSE